MLLLMSLMLSMTGFNIVAGQTIGDFRVVRVEIFNDLGDGLDLTVHCKSKDDDHGVHVISIQMAFLRSTLNQTFGGLHYTYVVFGGTVVN